MRLGVDARGGIAVVAEAGRPFRGGGEAHLRLSWFEAKHAAAAPVEGVERQNLAVDFAGSGAEGVSLW